ncbi:N-acetylmuramoyl-L-alanine amidase [Rhodoplanes roseus]|nr:N-acetylmuramoyl-L-alanine amidase [Rhodoplanes roseus]
MAWKGIVGQSFTPATFAAYVAGLRWTGWTPQFVVLHNTASPSLAQRPDGLTRQHIANLERYYRDDQHWSAGPHLFVDDRQIWVFTPLTKAGVHSPSWNAVALGVEMLGDFDREPFTSGRGAAVRANAVAAIAILCARLGLDPGTIRLHKEDKKTTHACPGKNVVKADVIAAVRARMAAGVDHASDHGEKVQPRPPTGDALRTRMAKHILDFEARRDKQGRLAVYRLPAGDQGGTYEVAGFNDRYHPDEAAELAGLIEAGQAEAAEAKACGYILRDTAPAADWTSDPGVEFMLRDTIHHRGRGGAAKVLQRAVGVDQDGDVGPATKAAAATMPPSILLPALRAAREAYEVEAYGRRAQFWRGFTARWDQALAFGLSLSGDHSVGVTKMVPPTVTTVPTPIALPERPGLLRTLWSALRGRDAPAPPPAAPVARPGLADEGDPALYDLQRQLGAKGYTMVGRPDGLAGPNTSAAIRTFRAEHGLGEGDQVDDEMRAALAKAGPRQIAASRAGATAAELRAQGSPEIKTLDDVGWLGKALGFGGVVGGIQQSGILDQAKETMASVGETAASITSIATTLIGAVQWCVTHWWLFAIGGGLWVVVKVALGVLDVVYKFRTGILTRADR